MPVQIVTDSTCDLPKDLAESKGIHVVPLYVLFGTETWLDGVNLDSRRFFEKVVSSGVHPTTSQPTPEDFVETYKRIPGEIFSLHIASALSGTYNSAVQATRLMEGEASRIRTWDSDSVTLGLGLLALEAAEAAAEGLAPAGIEARVQEARQTLRVCFTLESLDYLAKGGRIGRAQALLGGLLKVKPILSYDNGIVAPIAKAFGFDQALGKIVALAAEDHARKPIRRMFVVHGHAPQAAERLERMMREKLQGDFEVLHAEIGAVIGAHVGPGAAGLMYHS